MSDVETTVTPPDIDEDGDGGDTPSVRLGAHLIEVDDVSYDAAVQFFGDDATDPARFADALLNIALALASMRGPDYAWAVMQRFAAYDGMTR